MSEQSAYRSLREAVWAARLPTAELVVALRLVEHWPRIMPSIAGLAEFTGLSERAVQYALRDLEKRGLIRSFAQPGRRTTFEFVSDDGTAITVPALRGARGAPPTPAPGAPPGARGAPPTPAPGAPEADKILKQTSERDRARDAAAVTRTYSMPGPDPHPEYLAEATMGGVRQDQAISTWRHYFAAGLPERGVERLYQWLVQRALERANSLARREPTPAKRDSAQPSAGLTGWEWEKP